MITKEEIERIRQHRKKLVRIFRNNNKTFTDIDCFANRFIDPTGTEFQVFGIDWVCEKGLGRLEIHMDEDGKPHLYTECMGKDFARRILNAVVDAATLEE